jgi:hypothetical protein
VKLFLIRMDGVAAMPTPYRRVRLLPELALHCQRALSVVWFFGGWPARELRSG